MNLWSIILICLNSWKGGVGTLYQRILSEYQRIDNQIQSIRKEISKLPSGKLICCNHNNHSKWYHSDGHYKSYIPKNERSYAEQLAKKKYLNLLLGDLENEKISLEFYLRHHNPTDKSLELLTEPSEYQKLLAPSFQPLEQELNEWMHADYERNTYHEENLIFKSSSGNILRSKSEMMIDILLHIHNIPFRYESALYIDENPIFPDFTVRHPKSGQYYYWEHFGLMDNLTYAKNACSKIYTYTSHGIIPGVQLITTYETQDTPLGAEVIEKIIEHYFL